MDKDILLLFAGGTIGFLSSIGIALIAYLLDRNRQIKAWQREDEQKIRDSITSGVENFEMEIRSASKRSTILRDFKGEYCFTPGTVISLADRSSTSIELLNVGDSVLSFDLERNVYSSTTITAITKAESPPVITINDSLSVTSAHNIFTDEGWIRASKLSPSHNQRTVSNTSSPVDSIVIRKELTQVHCIVTNRLFFADGFLVGTFE